MKRRFSFLVILISLGVTAQEPPPADSETETPAETSAEGAGGEAEPDRTGEDADESPDDFRPSQEISEDYPVPLPADI